MSDVGEAGAGAGSDRRQGTGNKQQATGDK